MNCNIKTPWFMYTHIYIVYIYMWGGGVGPRRILIDLTICVGRSLLFYLITL